MLKSLRYEEPGLFAAAVMVLAGCVISLIRIVIVIVRFAQFDPALYDEDEMSHQGFYMLYNENTDFIERNIARYRFAQSPSYIKIMLYTVLVLFAVSFLIMYVKVCRESLVRMIPGILVLILMGCSIGIYVVRTLSRGETFGNVPNWALITSFILGLIALVVTGVFTLRDNFDLPVVNAKFFLISTLVCCLILPGLSYILFIVGMILFIFVMIKVANFLFDGVPGPKKVTIIDHETGKQFTTDKDNVKIE
ncbi:MAG: hypothetical protein K5888_01025 [Lachnospiraceae bacterium]|nr:hypothetical protein [Lachnospiraceae bacterium]